jgi:hypothetical protein
VVGKSLTDKESAIENNGDRLTPIEQTYLFVAIPEHIRKSSEIVNHFIFKSQHNIMLMDFYKKVKPLKRKEFWRDIAVMTLVSAT